MVLGTGNVRGNFGGQQGKIAPKDWVANERMEGMQTGRVFGGGSSRDLRLISCNQWGPNPETAHMACVPTQDVSVYALGSWSCYRPNSSRYSLIMLSVFALGQHCLGKDETCTCGVLLGYPVPLMQAHQRSRRSAKMLSGPSLVGALGRRKPRSSRVMVLTYPYCSS